jgi:hypothetical protein
MGFDDDMGMYGMVAGIWGSMYAFGYVLYTVKPAHAVTSIKQLPVLRGHIFIILS